MYRKAYSSYSDEPRKTKSHCAMRNKKNCFCKFLNFFRGNKIELLSSGFVFIPDAKLCFASVHWGLYYKQSVNTSYFIYYKITLGALVFYTELYHLRYYHWGRMLIRLLIKCL